MRKYLMLTVPGMIFFFSLQLCTCEAQVFQHYFGTPLDNAFSKVIRDGNFYYVLGQDQPAAGALSHATVTRLDANGMHLWTLGLNTPSVWNDAILIPGGDLLVVGSTVPVDPTAMSLIGRVTSVPNQFVWLQAFDEPGRDAFTRIIENSQPQNPNFRYYVLGYQHEPGGSATTEDVIMLNLDENGVLNWKIKYINAGDDEFARDFEALNSGDMLLSGNLASGVIFVTDNAGTMINGAQMVQRNFVDVEEGTAGIYAVAKSLTNNDVFLSKFDANLILQWDQQIPELNAISQVWEGAPGELYVTGTGSFGGQPRTAITKIQEAGPSVDWLQYLHVGGNAMNGTSWLLGSSELGYTDSRAISSGPGMQEAFISVSDLDLFTCEVSGDVATLQATSPVPDAPVLLIVQPMPVPAGTYLTETMSLNWQQGIACDSCICANQGIVSGLTLSSDGTDYPLACLPHGVQTPVIPCPTGDVVISGFFGCESVFTGEPCEETDVVWSLTNPDLSSGGSGVTTNFTSFIFPASQMSAPGTYHLSLSTLCTGAMDSCICTVDWIVECDSCCQDFDAFCAAVVNATSTTVNNDSCKATLTIQGLPPCDSITNVNWGDGAHDPGPYGNGTMLMHSYTGSGVYVISFLAIAYDQNGLICFEKFLADTIVIDCDTSSNACLFSPCPPGNAVWQNVSNDYFIQDMVAYQGQLIVAGSFNFSGANNIAAWNGTSWATLGTGINGAVEALTVHNGLLYAGGGFSMAGGVPASNIATWNGSVWTAPGTGTNGPVYSLESFGPDLIAGGGFSMAGSSSANNIATWNGFAWSSLGGGTNGAVHGIGIYNGALIAGGVFNMAGGSPANNIARWSGTAWTALGGGINLISGNIGQSVKAFQQLGPDLVVGGRFQDASGVAGTQFIALWNGTTWLSMATGVNTSFEGIYDLKLYGGELYAGGLFTQIGGNNISGVARWDGANWVSTGHPDDLVRALECYMAPGDQCDLFSGGEVFLNDWDCTTATSEIHLQTIRMFPNPGSGLYAVEISGEVITDGSLKIISLTGHTTWQSSIAIGRTIQMIDVQDLPSGMYFIQAISEGRVTAIGKFVKQ